MRNFGVNDELNIKNLHNVYEENIPNFIKEICESDEMKRITKVGQNCGRDYISSKIQNFSYNYTRYTHSIGVGLIVWRFTHNIKMSIAGLLHDIAAPCFSHVIDFYNNDAETQESTEERTKTIISGSKKMKEIFDKYGITVKDVWDYSMYPVADNEKPKLSADRLEYTCYTANSMGVCTIEEISEIINNIIIVKNEENKDEMCFKDAHIAEKFANIALMCNHFMAGGISTITNQLLADTLKIAVSKNVIEYEDFYNASEEYIVEKIDNCNEVEVLKLWNTLKNYTKVYESDEKLEGKYSIKVKVKVRYIDPLCFINGKPIRVSKYSSEFKNKLEEKINNVNKYYFSVDFCD